MPNQDSRSLIDAREGGSLDLFSRLPGEPSDAFAAFVIYRDLGAGHRSLMETCRVMDARRRRTKARTRLIFIDSPRENPETPVPERRERAARRQASGLVNRWSVKYRWVERARAWDDYLDKIRQNAYRDHVVKMAEEHSRLLAGGRKVLALVLNSFGQAMKDPVRAEAWNRLSPVDLFEMSMEAMKVMPRLMEAERLSTGVTVSLPGEETSPQGGDVEWIVETYEAPQEEPSFDLSKFETKEEATRWEGDQPTQPDEDPAEGQPFPPARS